jgi:hypothetical protein
MFFNNDTSLFCLCIGDDAKVFITSHQLILASSVKKKKSFVTSTPAYFATASASKKKFMTLTLA